MGEMNDIGCVKILMLATIKLEPRYVMRQLHHDRCSVTVATTKSALILHV